MYDNLSFVEDFAYSLVVNLKQIDSRAKQTSYPGTQFNLLTLPTKPRILC
jgi:hypothetical protein